MSNVAFHSGLRKDNLVSGFTTASLLVVTIVSPIIGGLAGTLLHGVLSPPLLAVVAGAAGTFAAAFARNILLISAWDAAGVEDPGTPTAVVIHALVASIAGSLAAYQSVSEVGPLWSGITGMLAGLLSAGLMSLLMATCRMELKRQG